MQLNISIEFIDKLNDALPGYENIIGIESLKKLHKDYCDKSTKYSTNNLLGLKAQYKDGSDHGWIIFLKNMNGNIKAGFVGDIVLHSKFRTQIVRIASIKKSLMHTGFCKYHCNYNDFVLIDGAQLMNQIDRL